MGAEYGEADQHGDTQRTDRGSDRRVILANTWLVIRRPCQTGRRTGLADTQVVLLNHQDHQFTTGCLHQFVEVRANTQVSLIAPHHHFIDEETGRIHDVPWDALRVSDVSALQDFDVREYQVVLRGRCRPTALKSTSLLAVWRTQGGP